MTTTIYCDASKWMGTNCAYCIFFSKKDKKIIVVEESKDIYQLEYLALIEALSLAPKDSVICMDNKGIVQELNFKKFPTARSEKLFIKAREIMNQHNIKVVWIRRERNLAGIALDKRLARLKKAIHSQDWYNKQTFRRNIRKQFKKKVYRKCK